MIFKSEFDFGMVLLFMCMYVYISYLLFCYVFLSFVYIDKVLLIWVDMFLYLGIIFFRFNSCFDFNKN